MIRIYSRLCFYLPCFPFSHKKGYLFNLERGVLFELYTKLLSFSSTQGSEIDGFAFEHVQGMKASATPAPKTSLIRSPLGCVKFTCKTEAYVS